MEIQILVHCFINTPIARIDNVSFTYTIHTWKFPLFKISNEITNQDIEEDVRNRTKLDIDIISWEAE